MPFTQPARLTTNQSTLYLSPQPYNGNFQAKHNKSLIVGKNGGMKNKKGGACCGATSINVPSFPAGASTGAFPNANYNILASTQHLANLNCASSGDSTSGWENLKGGSTALGGFMENLNNIKGGRKRRKQRRKSRQRKKNQKKRKTKRKKKRKKRRVVERCKNTRVRQRKKTRKKRR
tara:strand:- start:1471 stop:2001 length:531 start_codon:yes stop_codon:yes gene_type:complete